ncbi:MAG: Yip1 family protein [Halobacteriales archaeon]
MLAALRAALTDPASFFEREAAEPRLREPILIVAVVGIVGLLSSVPVFQAIMGAVPEAASPFVMIGLGLGAVIGLVSPFVIWLVYTVLFYGLSSLFDGIGEFRNLFAVVGWGFAPNILGQLVSGIVLVVLLSRGAFSNPQEAQQFARSATTGPLGVFNRGFGLLMTLWSAWIWTYAVAAVRGLSRREAAISVGVVVGAGILLGIASTFLV